MALTYSPSYCENCKQEQAGKGSFGQYVILALLCLTVIGGIIYFLAAKPNCCYICGVKRRHRKPKPAEKKQ